MQIFKNARYTSVEFILTELRKAKHRVFIEVICTVMLENENKEVKKAEAYGVRVANALASRINPETGLLTLNVSQKACPVLLIDNGVIKGAVSVNQMQCDFTVPIGCIIAIRDLTEQETETFNPFIEIAEVQPEQPKPENKKSHLTLVQ